MGPGAPGIALGGLFYLLLSLAGPGVELARAARGRSTAASRRLVARNFAIALSMLVALDLVFRGIALLSGPPEVGDVAAGGGPESAGAAGDGAATAVVALPVSPLLIGLGLLAFVLAATKVAELVLRRGTPGRPRPRRRPATGRPLEATGD